MALSELHGRVGMALSEFGVALSEPGVTRALTELGMAL